MFALHDVEGFEDEKEGVTRTEDVRRAMKYAAITTDLKRSQNQRLTILV